MKAIRFAKTGGPEVLSLQDVELPPPAPGQVRVRHTAIGVNFIDTYHRCGLYPLPLPSGLGMEAAGTVEAVGEGVTGLKQGDRVAYCTGPIGAYAEANNVPADRVVKLPAGISDEIAAAAMLKGMTAQYLAQAAPLRFKRGQTILFHAAAGGVGLIAVPMGQASGRHGHRHRRLRRQRSSWPRAMAATMCSICAKDDWLARVRELTGGEGVPVVYDSVGKDTFAGSLDCLALRGMMVSFGNSSGAGAAVRAGDPRAPRARSISPGRRCSTTRARRRNCRTTADDLFAVIASGAVKIAINQRFALKDARRGARSAAFAQDHGRDNANSVVGAS